MYLVASGAYVNEELQSNYGRIPPSFLPVKNTRLFVLQSLFFGKELKKYISLPNDFTVEKKDEQLLIEHNYEIIFSSSEQSLGELIFFFINNSCFSRNEELVLLLGDTYFMNNPFSNIDLKQNYFSISRVLDFYNWAYLDGEENNSNTYSGLFCFSNPIKFSDSLIRAGKQFENALKIFKLNEVVNFIEIEGWLDFGHANTYFRSKTNLTSERNFNQLSFVERVFVKTSNQHIKMEAEANWFEILPLPLTLHIPHYLGRTKKDESVGYSLEYLMNPTLSELLVFGKLPIIIWKQIINDSLSLTNRLYEYKTGNVINNFSQLIINKTQERVSNLNGIDINFDVPNIYNSKELPSFNEIIENSSSYLNSLTLEESIVHGDFCFSNILYVFSSQTIKVIDPRGLGLDGRISNKGSLLYDLSKYFHSIIGLYDFIVCNYFELSINGNEFNFEILVDENVVQIQKYFLTKYFKNIPIDHPFFYALNIHLFLSMISLHSEDKTRQHAFLANVLRLYLELTEKK
jgi:hypothetical protein